MPERGPARRALRAVLRGTDRASRGRSEQASERRTLQVARRRTDGGMLQPVAQRNQLANRSVDVARLAGLNPSGVICEIMNEDGTMARLDELVAFAARHSLKIGTIRDLIAYRCRHDHLIEVVSEASFASRWGGDWTVRAYRNKATGTEQIALVKGRIDPSAATLVRMHALSPFTDMFGEDTRRGYMLSRSMEMIAQHGSGAVVVINRDRADPFTTAVKMKAGEPIEFDMEELRDYGVGAMILADLGVRRLRQVDDAGLRDLRLRFGGG